MQRNTKKARVRSSGRCAEVLGIVRPEGRPRLSQPQGSHSLTSGSWLCLRIALRQLPLRKSTRADTLNAGDALQWGQDEGPAQTQRHMQGNKDGYFDQKSEEKTL